jgi:ketosteroid isomerase-like protein
MSQENVEIVKRGFTAIVRLDGEAMLEFMDPAIEFRPRFQLMLGGQEATYVGYAGVREAFRDVYAALDWIKPEVREIHDLGDRVLALGELRIRGKTPGIAAQSSAGGVGDMKDGTALRISEYLDPAEAVEAAGLSE